MENRKNLFFAMGEWWEQRRANLKHPQSSLKSKNLLKVLRWFIPNGGTLLLVIALISTQKVWANGVLGATNSSSGSATTINYQGRLADANGIPVADGDYAMSFAIFDAQTGGNLIWPANNPEVYAAVPVLKGLFSVPLGSKTPGGIPTNVWNGDRYLETTIGDEILSPRELIRGVPMAGMALTVPDGSLSKSKLGPDIQIPIIDSGNNYSSNYNIGYTLDTGSGQRNFLVHVNFVKTYSIPPTVSISLNEIDELSTKNTRINVYAINITKSGFDIDYSSWADSITYGVGASWIAIGY